ncbi:MAG: ABC transporter ATP-binding protein/permease [Chloroflexi bacterium]|nr:ABC transporter ATP-binding protein/permease [Chloroflexota bacterium]MCL5274542.1 ABC transporter ATP-binding protein/permease [Chloroflexota bacterium]
MLKTISKRSPRPAGLSKDELPSMPPREVMLRLFSYLKPYRRRMMLTVAIYMICVTISQFYPYIDRILIDNYITAKVLDQGFFVMVILAVALHILNYSGFMARSLSITTISQDLLFDLRSQLFYHIAHLSFNFHEAWPVGKTMSRFLSDVSTLNDFLTNQIAALFNDATSAVIIIILMFAINPGMALVALITLPVLFIAAAILRPRIHEGWEIVREYNTRFNIFLSENISGMRVIQAFVRENTNFNQFQQSNSTLVKSWLDVTNLSARLGPIVEITRAAGLAAVLYVASYQIGLSQSLTVGTLVAFTSYINALWGPISTFTNVYLVLQATMASAEKIFELLDTQPKVMDAPDAVDVGRVQGGITLEHVNFTYDGASNVLHDINLHIEPGQLVALVGQTGSGKTTIASLINRFYDVTGGRILIDDIDIRHMKQTSLHSQIAVVLQEPFIFTDTLLNNIRYGRPGATLPEVIRAARMANCHEFLAKLPYGYDTVAHERGSQFSGGQRQLISIARAILADTPILVLDEATSAVDTQTEMLIQEALERLMKGRTAIVIAHRLSTIRKADQIVVLKDGRIVETGNHESLVNLPDGYYARLCRAQMSGEH